MKIYTKTGDDGSTGLFGGPRVRKDDARIEAYGTVDELNAALAMVQVEDVPSPIFAVVNRVQHELFAVGAQLATPDPTAHATALITDERLAELESDIDRFEETLPPLKQFILPGGTAAATRLQFARTICRRAERHLITLVAQPQEHVDARMQIYLNRLSDLLFVLARAVNQAANVEDVPWQKPESK